MDRIRAIGSRNSGRTDAVAGHVHRWAECVGGEGVREVQGGVLATFDRVGWIGRRRTRDEHRVLK